MIFWGTFFPLIAELFTGERASLAAPWFDRYTTPLAIVLVLFTGIGPLLAWRRVTWASARRVFLGPLGRRRRGGRAGGALRPMPPRALGAAAVRLRRLRADRAGAGALARRRGAPGALRRLAARRDASPSPPATGAATAATSSTPGSRVLLIGVAASSSFQTNREVTLRPGRRARRSTTTRQLPAPDRRRRQRAHRLRRGARRQQGRAGVRPTLLARPATTSAPRPSRAARSAASSTARRPARSACGAACAPTSGPRCSPTPPRCCARRAAPTALRAHRRPRMPPRSGRRPRADRQQAGLLEQAQGDRDPPGRPDGYVDDPPPAIFRVIVNPLVSWMWIGAMIALAGALIAVWPSPGARRRRGSALRRRRGSAASSPGRRPVEVEILLGALLLCARGLLRARARCAPPRGRRAGGSADRRPRGRARRPSTARSATPSSTTRPASSPRRTSSARTPSCARRRSRSSTELERGAEGAGARPRISPPCTRSSA